LSTLHGCGADAALARFGAMLETALEGVELAA